MHGHITAAVRILVRRDGHLLLVIVRRCVVPAGIATTRLTVGADFHLKGARRAGRIGERRVRQLIGVARTLRNAEDVRTARRVAVNRKGVRMIGGHDE